MSFSDQMHPKRKAQETQYDLLIWWSSFVSEDLSQQSVGFALCHLSLKSHHSE